MMNDQETRAEGPPEGVAVANGPRADHPSWARYQVLAAGCALAVITYVHRVGFATVAAELQKPLGLDDAQLGWIMAAFAVGYGVFEMPWGLVGDRFGVRNGLTAIALGGSLFTAGLALVGWLPAGGLLVFVAFLALRFLFGAFQAGTFPVLSRMTADWMPITERGLAQGAVWMASRWGGFIAPFLIVQLFDHLPSWRLAVVLVAGIGVAWALAFWPWFRDRPQEMRGTNQLELALINSGRSTGAPHGHGHGHGPAPWGAMARSTNVWSLCLMYGFLGFSGNFYILLLPTYLKQHRHLDSATMSWLSGLPFALGMASCFAGGWISDVVVRRWGTRWGRRAVGGVGLAVASLAIAAVPWANGAVPLGFLLCLTFFSNDLAMGPAWAAAADIGERHTGVLSGAMNMTNALMGGLQSVILGSFFKAGFLTAPFLILAASYALGAFCWIGVDTRKTLAEPPKAHDVSPS